ncbi:MAG: SRPBCC domain-containing protein [Chlorobiales bacterium]|nr:SRPBCC domain-containing protein [Chlorobiales bacterium]
MSEHKSSGFSIVQEVKLNAPREKVWQAFTRDIDKWWPHRGRELNARMVFEPKVGGRLIEQRDTDSAEKLWGTVTFIKEKESIFLSGPIGLIRHALANVFGFDFEDKGEETAIKLTHEVYGNIDPEWEEGYNAGWQEQWQYLEAYLMEGKTWKEMEKAKASV